jgi:hypothetical protein
MDTEQGVVPRNLVAWLLEKDNPSVRYFTLKDLLGKSETDPEVSQARAAIPDSEVVAKILLRQKAAGYWENSCSPYRPKYKSTFWQAMMLGHVGLDKGNAKVRKAFEFVFKLQLREGGFSSHTKETALEEYEWMQTRAALKEKLQPEAEASARSLIREHQYSCLTGNLCAAMLRVGYWGDARLTKALNWLMRVQNIDGGWLCPYWKAHVRDTHGCFYGTICPLEALSEVPEPERSVEVRQAIERGAEFLLMHRLYMADHHKFRVINRQWLRFGFPWFYAYDTLRGLSVITKLGYLNDDRIVDALKLLIQKSQPDGRWLLDTSPTGRMQANVEPVGKPSKWITLYALRVLERLHETKNKRIREVLATYAPA